MFDIKNKLSSTPNPHLFVTKKNGTDSIKDITLDVVTEYIKLNNRKIDLLDIGGGKGWGSILYNNPNINYYCLDLKETKRSDNINYIKGDITDINLKLDKTFDILFSKDTFEHILNPWDTTNNLTKLLKNNGIILFFVPFSWRYHASPYDTYRYSHTGLQFIIERLGCIKKIQSGYIKFGNINGFWKNKKDYTINGKQFPNCLETFYLGIKNNTHKFTVNDLDADYNWRHDK